MALAREESEADYIRRNSLCLLKELQLMYYEVAREAELSSEGSLVKIQSLAEQSLRLIDSFITANQVEIGQLELELSPLGMGSIMHQVMDEVRPVVSREVGSVAGVNVAVMTNRDLLSSFLGSIIMFTAEATKSPLSIRSFLTSSGEVGIGVFARDMTITNKELDVALSSAGLTHMPFARYSSKSGYLVVLAEKLATSLGGKLYVKRLGKWRGFATSLPLSQQMSLM